MATLAERTGSTLFDRARNQWRRATTHVHLRLASKSNHPGSFMDSVYQTSRRVARRVKDGVMSGGSSAARNLASKFNGVTTGARAFLGRPPVEEVTVSLPQRVEPEWFLRDEEQALLNQIINVKELLKSGRPSATDALNKLKTDLKELADWSDDQDTPPAALASQALARWREGNTSAAIDLLNELMDHWSLPEIESDASTSCLKY